MDLKEVQILEIKNLDLIYVFTTSDIFTDNENKYVGVKIVYDKNKTLSLDYKDKHFSQFIKTILEKYNKEKDKRKIILLGDLTKKLVNGSSFNLKENKDSNTNKLSFFNASNKDVKQIYSYLKYALELIINTYKNYETFKIGDIKGFNKKYLIEIKIGNVIKEIPIIIWNSNDIINFRIGIIDGTLLNVFGTIENLGSKFEIKFNDKEEKIFGNVIFDSITNSITKKIETEEETILYSEENSEIDYKDYEKINFYFDLFNLEQPKNILKVDSYNYLLGEETKDIEKEKDVLFQNNGIMLNINDDSVFLNFDKKYCLSKYNNVINTIIDEENINISLKSIKIDEEIYLIKEQKIKINEEEMYSYELIEVEDFTSFKNEFKVKNIYKVNETTKEELEENIRKRKVVK